MRNPILALTRSQRIRTTLVIPFEAVFLEATAPPIYQIIAAEAQHLQKLSLSAARIAQSLGVTDKTVTKALAWLAHHDECDAPFNWVPFAIFCNGH